MLSFRPENIQIIDWIYLKKIMEEDFAMYKIVIIGSSGTGKTNMCSRYINDKYIESQTSTVGVEFLTKTVQLREKQVKVSFWDTAGQERYKSMNKLYYKGANGVLVVYDITDPQSYINIESWIRYANQNLNLEEVEMIIVGNKMDLQSERTVYAKRAIQEYKERFDVDCWEVSAKTGQNVNELFATLIQRIHDRSVKRSVFVDQSVNYESVSERNSTNQQHLKEGALKNTSTIKKVEVEYEGKRVGRQLVELHSSSIKKSKDAINSIQLGSSKYRQSRSHAQNSSTGKKSMCC